MARIDTAFLLVASACLIIGVCLGIYMGVNEDLQLVAVHTHISLVGWASLAHHESPVGASHGHNIGPDFSQSSSAPEKDGRAAP